MQITTDGLSRRGRRIPTSSVWLVMVCADQCARRMVCTDVASAHNYTTNPFNGIFSRTTWVSRYQKGLKWGKRYSGIQGHQLEHMQTVCTSLQTAKHTNTSLLNFYKPYAIPDAQPCQSTEGKSTQGKYKHKEIKNKIDILIKSTMCSAEIY